MVAGNKAGELSRVYDNAASDSEDILHTTLIVYDNLHPVSIKANLGNKKVNLGINMETIVSDTGSSRTTPS